jgi:hypothetical protein
MAEDFDQEWPPLPLFSLSLARNAELPLHTGQEMFCSRVSLGVRGVVLGVLSKKTGERRRGLGFIRSVRVHGGLGAGEGEEGSRDLAIGYGRQCGRRRQACLVVLEASKCKLALAPFRPTMHCRCLTERRHSGSRHRRVQRVIESWHAPEASGTPPLSACVNKMDRRGRDVEPGVMPTMTWPALVGGRWEARAHERASGLAWGLHEVHGPCCACEFGRRVIRLKRIYNF